LSEIRRTGYAVSLEEYEPGVNAVASPIERAGEAYLVAGLVGPARDLPVRRIEEIGPKLARAARELREGLGIAGGDST
jgi:DNA-binding IclR family transcriptional regulator